MDTSASVYISNGSHKLETMPPNRQITVYSIYGLRVFSAAVAAAAAPTFYRAQPRTPCIAAVGLPRPDVSMWLVIGSAWCCRVMMTQSCAELQSVRSRCDTSTPRHWRLARCRGRPTTAAPRQSGTIFYSRNPLKFHVSRRFTFWQWCSPRDQGLGLEAPRGQKLKSWSWSWIMKSWSWSWTFGLGFGLGLGEKVLQFFKTFVVILDGSEQGTLWHFVRQQKQFAIRKPLFERTFSAPYTSASAERVFKTGLFVGPHRRQ